MISPSHKILGSYISLFCWETGVQVKFITLILVLSPYQLEIKYGTVERELLNFIFFEPTIVLKNVF